MDRIFILRGRIRKSDVVFGYYKSQKGAMQGLIRQEAAFSSKGIRNEIITPFCGEVETRNLYDNKTSEYYGCLFIESNILND